MSDPNWKAPEPGDPGTPRDVNRDGDIVWDGNDPERFAGQGESTEDVNEPKKATKRTARSKSTTDSGTEAA